LASAPATIDAVSLAKVDATLTVGGIEISAFFLLLHRDIASRALEVRRAVWPAEAKTSPSRIRLAGNASAVSAAEVSIIKARLAGDIIDTAAEGIQSASAGRSVANTRSSLTLAHTIAAAAAGASQNLALAIA